MCYLAEVDRSLKQKTKLQNKQQKQCTGYIVLKRSKELMSLEIQIVLFKKMVKPILLYGCERWGYGSNVVLERVQLRFLKYI